jgi:hypothetical protein
MAVDWRPFPKMAARLTVPVALWIARAWLASTCSDVGCISVFAADILLIPAHWWANSPMAGVNGGQAGINNSVTKIFMVPMAIAVFLASVDGLAVGRALVARFSP